MPSNLTEIITHVLANLQTQAKTEFLHWIKTQQKDATRLIPVEAIDYFQAEDKYTLVMTAEGESLIKKSINELAQELDPQQFWQIHRATIVNVSRIENVSRSFTGRGIMKLKKRSESLTVSRNYLHLFKRM